MPPLIPYLIKSTSILLILLVYYKLFLRKQTFFYLNRLYLLSALLIAIVTPFISIEIQSLTSAPAVQHPIKTYMSNLLEEVYVIGNYSTEITPTVNYNHFSPLFILYWAGTIFFILRYILAFIQIQKLKYQNPHRHFRGINIIILPATQPAFSYFNNLFISSSLSREDRHKIFEHEKIHICQCHSLDLLITEIICISNWFNPFVWILKNTIMENHEYIADHQVIRRFHTGSYLELLLRQTFKSAFSFTNYVSCSNLKKRTIMMTKKQSRKYWVLSFVPITAVLVTLLYGFTCNKTAPSVFPIVIPEFTELEIEIPNASGYFEKTQQNDTVIYTVVDQMPQFSGGNVHKWVSRNVKYPPEAIEKKIQGKVYVQFIVEKDGSIGNIKIVRSVHPLLDNAALKIFENMPQWKPGKQKGEVVRVSYTLPITFSVHSSNKKSLTPEEKYTAYLKEVEKSELKLHDPSLLDENDKRNLNAVIWYNKAQNDQEVYEEMLEKIQKGYIPFLNRSEKIMDSLNFSTTEKETVKQIYQKQLEDNIQFIKDLGPKNFIRNFSAITNFERSKINTVANIALKNKLSPERHKQLIIGNFSWSDHSTPIKEEIFVVVQEIPKFTGGDIHKWLVKNIIYPENAVKNKIEGKVYVTFVIEKDGSITNVKVAKGLDPSLDQEAIRIVQSMPKWIPGKQRGKTVRVSYTLPILFRLPK